MSGERGSSGWHARHCLVPLMSPSECICAHHACQIIVSAAGVSFPSSVWQLSSRLSVSVFVLRVSMTRYSVTLDDYETYADDYCTTSGYACCLLAYIRV